MTKAEGPTRGVGLLSGTHSRMPPPLPACEWGQEGPLPPASRQPLLMREVGSLTVGKLVSSFQKEIRHSFRSPGRSHGAASKVHSCGVCVAVLSLASQVHVCKRSPAHGLQQRAPGSC